MNFTQIEQLWTKNGGDPAWAPLMAGIAMAESGGNPTALNNNPKTGDYSVGLWQINYYNGLLASRTKDFGSPSQLMGNVNAQAKAAIALFGGGPGITNWKGDSTYNAWMAAGAPQKPSAAVVGGWLKQTGAGFGNAEAVTGSGTPVPDVNLGNLSGCNTKGPNGDGVLFAFPGSGLPLIGSLAPTITYCQLKSWLGAGAIVVGGITMGLGVILVAAFGLVGSRTGRQATALASRAPGPVGSAAKGIRSVSSGKAAPAKVKAPATVEEPEGAHVARGRHARGAGVRSTEAVRRHKETVGREEAEENAFQTKEARAADRRNLRVMGRTPRTDREDFQRRTA